MAKFRSNKDILIKRMYKAVTFLSVLLIISAIYFSCKILYIENISSQVYLEQSVLQTASNLKGRIRNDINNLKILSAVLSSQTSTYSEAEVTNFLKQNISKDNYHQLGFAYTDGTAVSYNSKTGKMPSARWNNEPCFDNALSGNPCFSATNENSTADSGFVNKYYVPVFSGNGEITGVLGSEIDSDVFKKILNNNDYNGKGFAHVIDSDGNYVIKSQSENNNVLNFFDLDAKFIGTTKEEVQEALKTKESGTFKFKPKGGKVYSAAFAFIGNNNSYVLTDVPHDVLMLHINTLLGGLSVFILAVIVLLLALLRYVESLYRQNEAAVFQVAFADDITENGNKAKFLLDAGEIYEKNRKNLYAMIAVGISNFAEVKKLLGEKISYKILKDLYMIIKRNLSQGSLCARNTESDYLVFYKYEKQDFIVQYFINKVLAETEKYNEEVIPELSVNAKILIKLSLTFGVYIPEDKNISPVQMCEKAEVAKNSIGSDSSSEYRFYDDGIRAGIFQAKAIEDEMFKALEENRFKMYLQPKIDMFTSEIVGAEALVRWTHQTRGIIPPMEFLPYFEKNGFVINMDKCIWKQACEIIDIRKRSGEKVFPVSVNISELHINNEAFADELLSLCGQYGVEPCFIELEFTEKAFLNNKDKFRAVMQILKAEGFRTALDDFGTGCSSLNILREVPLDVLKLDHNFITELMADEKGLNIIKSITEMAEQLGIETVAEGVETQEQAEFLKQAGCRYAQGFLYGRPLDVIKFGQTFL